MTCDIPLPLEEIASMFSVAPDRLCFLWARLLSAPDYWEIAGIGDYDTCELRAVNPMFRNAETVILPATETPMMEAT